jgi:hypothetical protein
VLPDHELDAEVRIPFFAGLGEENDVAIERDALPLQQQHRHQRAGDVVLVVHRPARVDVAAFARRAERRVLPFRRVDGDHVGVRHDEQRALPAAALEPRHEVRPLRIERDDLDRDAFGVEDLFEVVDRQMPRCQVDCWYRAAAPPGSAASSRPRAPSNRAPRESGRARLPHTSGDNREHDNGACHGEARRARRQEREPFRRARRSAESLALRDTRPFCPREIRHDVPVEADEAVQLALEQPLLIAVRAEAFRRVLEVDRRADAEALHALARSCAMSVAPVLIIGSVGAL